MFRIVILACLAVVAVVGNGCGGARDPVERLSRELNRHPEFSVMVEDLKVEEGYFPDFFLRFKILAAAGQRIAGKDTVVYQQELTPWEQVDEGTFARYEKYVGMVVASKSMDGQRTGVRQAHPAGYQHVGNPQYGHWGAGGFWQFYGQYALMRDMMGGWRVNRDDYGNYRRNSDGGRPYYGPVKDGRATFGSGGSMTQKTRPNFYQRNRQRLSSGRRAFASKAQGRFGRTSSSWGAGRFGK